MHTMKKILSCVLAVAAVASLTFTSCSPYHCNGSWRGGSVTGRNVFGPKRSALPMPALPQNPAVSAKEIRL